MQMFFHVLNSCVICIAALVNNASRCIEENLNLKRAVEI
jgi:hypothetical protein